METSANQPRLLRVTEVARLLYGESTTATRARVVRMVNRGELRAIRIGGRRDRWIPIEAVEQLLGGAS